MIDLATLVFGPLVVPECQRSLGRGWLISVRTVVGATLALPALSFVWWWWFGVHFEPSFSPYTLLRVGLHTLLFMTLMIALVLTPAVLAGSLAGEMERGSLGLLLTTRVNGLEIVLGRLAGKLTQVGIILMAGFPFLVLFGALAGLRASVMMTVFALPVAVAFGCGGMALGSSALARRGRDALMMVYLVLLVLMLSPIAASVPGMGPWARVELFNPFVCLESLIWDEAPGFALATSGLWVFLGLAGVALAAWRVRPACLGLLAGESRNGRRSWRRWRVPPLGDRRPMLWKELYIERTGSLGRFGRWIGLVIVLALVVGSTTLAGFAGHARWVRPDVALESYYVTLLGRWFADTRRWVAVLIELAIGLRAAVAIASERERGTWDALLTSPLEGREIVLGKLLGSLKSLRWLVLAAVWAWTLATVLGALRPGQLAETLAATLAVGVLMAAVGVRTSLATSTAARAMAITSGLWLGALAVVSVLATLLLVVAMLTILALFSLAASYELSMTTGAIRSVAGYWSIGWAITVPLLYVAFAGLVVLECQLRFDRLAGRATGGGAALVVDQWVHGPPLESAPPVPTPLGIERERPRLIAEDRD